MPPDADRDNRRPTSSTRTTTTTSGHRPRGRGPTPHSSSMTDDPSAATEDELYDVDTTGSDDTARTMNTSRGLSATLQDAIEKIGDYDDDDDGSSAAPSTLVQHAKIRGRAVYGNGHTPSQVDRNGSGGNHHEQQRHPHYGKSHHNGGQHHYHHEDYSHHHASRNGHSRSPPSVMSRKSTTTASSASSSSSSSSACLSNTPVTPRRRHDKSHHRQKQHPMTAADEDTENGSVRSEGIHMVDMVDPHSVDFEPLLTSMNGAAMSMELAHYPGGKAMMEPPPPERQQYHTHHEYHQYPHCGDGGDNVEEEWTTHSPEPRRVKNPSRFHYAVHTNTESSRRRKRTSTPRHQSVSSNADPPMPHGSYSPSSSSSSSSSTLCCPCWWCSYPCRALWALLVARSCCGCCCGGGSGGGKSTTSHYSRSHHKYSKLRSSDVNFDTMHPESSDYPTASKSLSLCAAFFIVMFAATAISSPTSSSQFAGLVSRQSTLSSSKTHTQRLRYAGKNLAPPPHTAMGGGDAQDGADDDLQVNYAEVTDRTIEIMDLPVFWTIPRSGTEGMKHLFSFCMARPIATEAGGTDGHELEEQLKLFRRDNGNYVNVDTTSVSGLKRARDLGLTSSKMASVIFTPLVQEASMLFDVNHRGRLFTMMRDPVERIVSLFYDHLHADPEAQIRVQREQSVLADGQQQQQQDSPNVSMKQFVQAQVTSGQDNWMVRRLAGKNADDSVDDGQVLTRRELNRAKEFLRRKFLVGLWTQTTESFRRFESYFGWKMPSPVAQACKNNVFYFAKLNRNPHPPLSPEDAVTSLIQTVNALDMELYEYAKQLFDEQRALFWSNDEQEWIDVQVLEDDDEEEVDDHDDDDEEPEEISITGLANTNEGELSITAFQGEASTDPTDTTMQQPPQPPPEQPEQPPPPPPVPEEQQQPPPPPPEGQQPPPPPPPPPEGQQPPPPPPPEGQQPPPPPPEGQQPPPPPPEGQQPPPPEGQQSPPPEGQQPPPPEGQQPPPPEGQQQPPPPQ